MVARYCSRHFLPDADAEKFDRHSLREVKNCTGPISCQVSLSPEAVRRIIKTMIQDLSSHTAAQLECDESLYKRVALRISELIEHGTLRPSERVPSVRRCSEQQNVSITTVTQAYRLLENRGIIEARPQSGYYVRAQRWSPPPEPEKSTPAPRAVRVKVSDLVMQVVKAGRDPSLVKLGDLAQPRIVPSQGAQPHYGCGGPTGTSGRAQLRTAARQSRLARAGGPSRDGGGLHAFTRRHHYDSRRERSDQSLPARRGQAWGCDCHRVAHLFRDFANNRVAGDAGLRDPDLSARRHLLG